MYNKATITAVRDMCTVEVEHRHNKKKCKFFVVPGNGQALLGMPDTDALNPYSATCNYSCDQLFGRKSALAGTFECHQV